MFRVFVSSTFEDLKEERDALQRDSFPKLRKLCEMHGARFQAIDLRWGVRDEATLDQKTLEICLREIERCQRTGMKPNFIVLLGQRYGWRPLPSRIEAHEFEAVRDRVATEEYRSLVENWYRRDDNVVPPEYLLQPRSDEWVDSEHWESLEALLHRVLLGAARSAGLPELALNKYGKSAMHQEILKGVGVTSADREDVFAFCRNVPHDDCDPELVNLKAFLRAQLPPGNILSYEPEKFAELCQEVERTLGRVIENEMARVSSRSALALEIEVHNDFARDRALVFGRGEVLTTITKYITEGGDRPLVLHGASGCGKSAVMAQASEKAGSELPSAVVVRRFIGASPESSSGLALLASLAQQIGQEYGATGEIPTDFNSMVRVFRERLELATSERPLVVFIDALDQLGKDDPARALNWVNATLPAHCRIVVSTTDLAPALNECRPLHLGPLRTADAAAALDHWLGSAHRQLQSGQRHKLLAAFARCGLPLYLKLAFEESRGWESYLPPDECLLGEGVEGMIGTLLTRLSLNANHGLLLVSRSLGYLSAARNGLTEDEMFDVLSADKAVWQDFERRVHFAPPQRRLPVIVWSRLLMDLEPYLYARQADDLLVMGFYHPQLHKAATEYYLDGPAKRHRHLHLAYLFDRACKGEGNTYLPLKRPIAEVAYHYRMCDSWKQLTALYGNVSYLCSYVKSHDAFELKEEIEATPDQCIDREVRAFVANAASLLVKHPEQAPQLMYKELAAESYRQQARRLAVRPWIRADRLPVPHEGSNDPVGVSPLVSLDIRVQASCVATSANLAFIHNAPNKIELFKTNDLRPRGEIAVPEKPSLSIKVLLCDRWGRLLAAVYDNGEVEVLKTVFSPSGNILSADCVHRGVCLVGKFGAIPACSSLDEIIYQAPDGRIVSLHLDAASRVASNSVPSAGRVLTSYFGSNVRCLAWREGKRHLLTFPESNARVDIAYRAVAICQLKTRLAVSTEESKLLIYRLPDLDIERVIPCRRPILSMSPTDGGLLLMTDRHGNILSLDDDLQLVEHGRCSYDMVDDYPSAVYPAGDGAFFVSNRRCVTLSLGSESKRDILDVDGEDDHYNLLTYSRATGYMLSIGGAVPRPLRQHIVGNQYEFEFKKFKAAWSASGALAYTETDFSVVLESAGQSTHHRTESEIVKILYLETLDAFLVFCRSGLFHLIAVEKAESFRLQSARSDASHYLIQDCGLYLCVVSHDVLCRRAFGNTYLETVLSLYRLHRSRGSIQAEVVDLQHINNRQPRILNLAYHRGSNTLYLYRLGDLERWQLDDPKQHNHTRIAVPSDRDVALPFCADENGGFYVDTSNQLKFLPMTSGEKTPELASFRAITFLSQAVRKYAYIVEDNQALYRFVIEKE